MRHSRSCKISGSFSWCLAHSAVNTSSDRLNVKARDDPEWEPHLHFVKLLAPSRHGPLHTHETSHKGHVVPSSLCLTFLSATARISLRKRSASLCAILAQLANFQSLASKPSLSMLNEHPGLTADSGSFGTVETGSCSCLLPWPTDISGKSRLMRTHMVLSAMWCLNVFDTCAYNVSELKLGNLTTTATCDTCTGQA